MSSEVIREFLVALGFKVDIAQEKRFDGWLDKAGRGLGKFASGIEAAALAAVAVVQKVSSKLEGLYYVSKRTGAPVAELRAFRAAIGQVGGSADAAQSSLESMAQTLRNNPGMEGYLNGLGVSTRNAKGEMRSMVDVATDLSKALKNTSYPIAVRQAGLLGIDESTLQALMRPEFAQALKGMREENKRAGYDQDKAAEASHRWMERLRDLRYYIELVGDKLVMMYQGPIARAFEWIKNTDTATGGWSTRLGLLFAILAPILALLGPVPALIAGVAAWLVMAANNSQSFRDALDVLNTQVEQLGVTLGPLMKQLGPSFRDQMKASVKELTSMTLQLAMFVRLMDDIASKRWGKAWDDVKMLFSPDAGGGERWKRDAAAMLGGGASTPVGGGRSSGGSVGAAAEAAAKKYGIPAAVSLAQFQLESGGGKHMPTGSNNPFGIKARKGEEYVEAITTEVINGRSQRMSQHFRKFKSMTEAFEQHARLLATSPRYAKARQFVNDPGKFADALTGVYATDPNYGSKLRGIMGKMGGARLGGDQSAVNINQKTDVHVHGVQDARRAGAAVASEQGRVNSDLVRNMKAAAA